MRSLCRIAPKLGGPMKNLSKQFFNNHRLSKYSTQYSKIPKRQRVASQNYPEEVARAIEEIAKDKAGRFTRGQTLYLIDEEAAKKFVALITPNIKKYSKSYVAEMNSGLGFVSEQLLESGIPSVHLFEGVPYLLPNLISIIDKYPGRGTVRPVNFQHMWSVGYLDWKENNNRLQTYFDGVENKCWTDDPAVQIVGAVGDLNFIRRLMSTIVFRNGLARFGRMVLHFALPPSSWAHFTCSNRYYDLYRWHTILFQTLFNYELLGTLPRSAFYPHYRQPNTRKRRTICRINISKDDGQLMNVVKVEPKADLFEHDFTVSDIVPFYYFLHHHLKSRSDRIIPALEEWVPGCGRTLINHGFNIYTEFGELTPQEILNLFKIFRSWPEFKHSSFVSCMDSFLMRQDENVGFDANADDLGEMFEFSLDETQ